MNRVDGQLAMSRAIGDWQVTPSNTNIETHTHTHTYKHRHTHTQTRHTNTRTHEHTRIWYARNSTRPLSSQYKANPNLKLDEQKVNAVPDIVKTVATEGDVLLICCDGIVEQMTNDDAAACVLEVCAKMRSESNDIDPARVCWELNRLSLQRGSKDNHSAMLVCFESGEAYHGGKHPTYPTHPYPTHPILTNRRNI